MPSLESMSVPPVVSNAEEKEEKEIRPGTEKETSSQDTSEALLQEEKKTPGTKPQNESEMIPLEAQSEEGNAKEEAPANTLWKGMSHKEMMESATKATKEAAGRREMAANELFEKVSAEQKQMVDEELLKNRINRIDESAPASSEQNSTRPQTERNNSEPGALQGMLAKFEKIPGGKALYLALTLVVGLSAIPANDAKASDWGGTWKNIFQSSAQQVIPQVIQTPINIYQQKQQFEMQMKMQEKQMQMQIQQQEMQMKMQQAQQERQYKMQQEQQEMQMKMQEKAAESAEAAQVRQQELSAKQQAANLEAQEKQQERQYKMQQEQQERQQKRHN